MSEAVIVALVSGAFTMLGSFAGIIASAKLTAYRIEQLEKKVDEHNNFARRVPVIEEKIAVANHRIDDLERLVVK